MVSSSQIKEQLARFLEGQIHLDAFEDWFVASTWNVHLSGSVSAEDLTFAVEESLSEFSSEHIDKRELRDELANLIHRDNKILVFNEVPATSWSTGTSPALVLAFARP